MRWVFQTGLFGIEIFLRLDNSLDKIFFFVVKLVKRHVKAVIKVLN